MRTRILTTLLAFFGIAATASAAANYPDEYALRPIQLPASMVQVKLPLIMDLTRDAAGKKIFVPFDIRLGLTDEIELRLFHPVAGLCLRGCPERYNDLALELLYSALDERDVQASLLGAFEVRSFASPVQLVLDVGLSLAYFHAPFSVRAAPYLGIPVSDREHQPDSVNVPIEFAFQLSLPTAVFLETGLYGSVRDPNGWSGPVGVGINQLLHRGVDIGAEFKLNSIIGHADAGSRLVLVYLMVRG